MERTSDRKTNEKKGEISISVYLSYLHRSSMTVFDINFLRVSTSPSLPQGPESQMSHTPGPLSILVVVWQCFSEVCDWILGTVGARQVAVSRATELHCCL